jgi:hypothetical protein
MYAGLGSRWVPGGQYESNALGLGGGYACSVLAPWTIADVFEGTLTAEPGTVVPDSLQSRAQHKRAATASGVSTRWRALAQQSAIPSIPDIEQVCSVECKGRPARTLLLSAARRKRDVRDFLICTKSYIGFGWMSRFRFGMGNRRAS